MASEIRVNTINNRSGLGTITISDSGHVFAGVTTITNLQVTGSTTGVASTDNIRTNTNATFLQNVNISGVTTVSAGSASAPSITATGDLDTGIFFPAADTIGFAEGGSESARIDSSGRLLVGTTSSTSVASKNSAIQISRSHSSTLNASILIREVENNTAWPALFINKNKDGNAMQTDNRLGAIEFAGDTGSSDLVSAKIDAEAEAGWSASSLPTRLVFSTTASSSTTPTERMRITSAGLMGLGTASPAVTFHAEASQAELQLKSTSGTNSAGLRFVPGGQTNALYIYADGNRNINIDNHATSIASFLAGGGLTFNGDTAAANALDDYEEGTWTPTLSFGGTACTMGTGSANAGRYVKVGGMCYCTFNMNHTSKNGASGGSASLGGFPFSSLGATQSFYNGYIQLAGGCSLPTGCVGLMLYQGTGGNTSRILVGTTTGHADLNATQAANNQSYYGYIVFAVG